MWRRIGTYDYHATVSRACEALGAVSFTRYGPCDGPPIADGADSIVCRLADGSEVVLVYEKWVPLSERMAEQSKRSR